MGAYGMAPPQMPQNPFVASVASMPYDSLADEKIRKRVGWLNRNVQLAAELKYDRIAPLLLGLDSPIAMEILKSVEENAATVRDPTGYVVSAAQRRLGGNVGFVTGAVPTTGAVNSNA